MAVYLLHFDRPFGHAGHYRGFAKGNTQADIDRRVAQHGTRRGSKLMYAVRKAGIGWTLARVWLDYGQKDERRLKQNPGRRYCPLCRAAKVAVEATNERN